MGLQLITVFRAMSGEGVAQEAEKEGLQVCLRTEPFRLIHEDKGVDELLHLPDLEPRSKLGLSSRKFPLGPTLSKDIVE